MKKTLLISALLFSSTSFSNDLNQNTHYNIIPKDNICFSTVTKKEKNIEHVNAKLISCEDKNIEYQDAIKNKNTEFILINGEVISSTASNNKTYVVGIKGVFYKIKDERCYTITIDNKITSVDCRVNF